MKLFKKIFSNNIEVVEAIAKCPYCLYQLKKTPGSKTKCPSCKKYMFVRTRPTDRKRVVVTQEEADKIEEEWSIVSGTHEMYIQRKEDYENERKTLKTRFGQEPSDSDIKWGLFNKELLQHAREGNWGLYRNTRFMMGELLRKELKFKLALRTYLEVCYLDNNGPENGGYIPFDKNGLTFFAPAIIDYIHRLVIHLKLSIEDLKQLYVDVNKPVSKNLKLPVSPEESWLQFKRAYTNPKVYDKYIQIESEKKRKALLDKYNLK